MKSFIEQTREGFEAYWAVAPVFPIPEEHDRHRIYAQTAYFAGVAAGIDMATKKMAAART